MKWGGTVFLAALFFCSGVSAQEQALDGAAAAPYLHPQKVAASQRYGLGNEVGKEVALGVDGRLLGDRRAHSGKSTGCVAEAPAAFLGQEVCEPIVVVFDEVVSNHEELVAERETSIGVRR